MKKRIFFILLSSLVFSFALSAKAENISQLLDDTTSSYLGTTGGFQRLGTGLIGTIDTMSVEFSTGGGLGGTRPEMDLYSCPDNTYTGCTLLWQKQFGLTGVSDPKTIYSATTSPITINPALYYEIRVICWNNCYNGTGTNAPLYAWGASASVGDFEDFNSTQAGNLKTLYFQISGTDTGSIAVLSPQNGQTIYANEFESKVEYYQYSSGILPLPQIVFTLVSGNANFTPGWTWTYKENTGFCCGYGSSTIPSKLPNGTFEYQAQFWDYFGGTPQIVSATGTIIVSGLSGYFTEPDFNVDVYINANPNVSTSSVENICGEWSFSDTLPYTLCSTGVLLFVPNSDVTSQFLGIGEIMKEKIPFSYVYEIISGIANYSTTTQNFPTIYLEGADLMNGTTTDRYLVFATSTIDRYLSDSYRIFFRSLVLAGLIAVVALKIWNDAHNIVK